MHGLVTITCTIDLLTVLLEYLNFFDEFVQSAADKALLLPQNASIIPDSYIPIYTFEIMLA